MNHTFVSKTNYAFYQTVFKSLAVLATIIFLSLKAYQISNLYLVVLVHKIKDACGCETMAQFFAMHPDIFRAVILFGAGIGIFIFYSLYKLLKLNWLTHKYIAHYLSFSNPGHSAKLKSAIKDLDLDEIRVIEINKPDLAVFCFGFRRPKICISKSLVDMLDPEELKAVLAHESRHMVSYEPLKLFIVKYFRNIFFFIPGLKTSAKKYITFSELAADEKATQNASGRSGLAGAILKISEQEEYKVKKGAFLSYFGSSMEERANRLSDEAYAPEFRFLDKSLIAGSLGLAVVSLFLIFIFSSSTKAFEMHNISGCVNPVGTENGLACSVSPKEKYPFGSGIGLSGTNGVDLDQNSPCQAN